MLNTSRLWRAWVRSREPLWCYWRPPWATGERQGSLFSDKGSRWESSHRVNRKGITSKQPVNKYEIICPTGQFCPGLFTPKPACVFSRIADLHDLITACYFELPALISPNSTAIPKYCSGFKFNSFCLNDEWAIQPSRPGECSYFFIHQFLSKSAQQQVFLELLVCASHCAELGVKDSSR